MRNTAKQNRPNEKGDRKHDYSAVVVVAAATATRKRVKNVEAL